jgi:hypothetical protein
MQSEKVFGFYGRRAERALHDPNSDDRRAHATGVLVLLDGTIMGGDTHSYYTGAYTKKKRQMAR